MGVSVNGNNINVPGAATVGSLILTLVKTAINYLAAATDEVIVITGPGVTVTLPTAVGVNGKRYTVKLNGTSIGWVGTTSGQTIDGGTLYTLSENYQHMTCVSDGANWQIIEGWLPTPSYTNLY